MILDILMTFGEPQINRDECSFNGYLEDYLQMLDNRDESILVLFQNVVEKYPNARICVGLKFAINKDVVSNQIIGYKDAFKLVGRSLTCPYLIYLNQNDEERLFLVTGNKTASYLFAKSLYFCLTEPTSIFEKYKNYIITMDSVNTLNATQIFEEAFDRPAGVLQRRIDQDRYSSYDELRDDAMRVALAVKENAVELIRPLEDKESVIKETVATWFLLKKLVYVQFMINKSILESQFQGDVKKQRAEARENSKAIPFIAYSELWRCGGDNMPITKEIAVEESSENL